MAASVRRSADPQPTLPIEVSLSRLLGTLRAYLSINDSQGVQARLITGVLPYFQDAVHEEAVRGTKGPDALDGLLALLVHMSMSTVAATCEPASHEAALRMLGNNLRDISIARLKAANDSR